MKDKEIDIELKRIVFAHHYGYRVVAISEGVSDDIINALQASKYHLYFNERKLEEIYRPIKFRYFQLDVKNEIYYLVARLEAKEDVITGRGLASFCQFYLIDKEQRLEFINNFANAADLLAQINFINIDLTKLRRGKIESIEPFKRSLKIKDFESQTQKLKNNLNKNEFSVLFGTKALEALDKGQKIFFYSKRFADSINIFNGFCRSFISAQLSCYQKNISFTTAEFTTNIDEYNLVFLHSAANISNIKDRENIKIFKLDEPKADKIALWYLDGHELTNVSMHQYHRILSDRIAIRNYRTIEKLKPYCDFILDKDRGSSNFEFTSILSIIEDCILDLDVVQIGLDFGEFFENCTQKNTCNLNQCFVFFNESVENLLSKADDFLGLSKNIILYTLICLEHIKNYNFNLARKNSLMSKTIKLFFDSEINIQEDIINSLINNNKVENIKELVCHYFIFCGKYVSLSLDAHERFINLVKKAFYNNLSFTEIYDEIKIQEELLQNLNLIEADSKRIERDDNSISYFLPEFDKRFSKLSVKMQNDFINNLRGFIKHEKELGGVILPVLWSYLRKTPEIDATDGCFDDMVIYLNEKLFGKWRDEHHRQIELLCQDLKKIPYNIIRKKETMAGDTNKLLEDFDYKDCIVQILLTSQNKESRIDKIFKSYLMNELDDSVKISIKGRFEKVNEITKI